MGIDWRNPDTNLSLAELLKSWKRGEKQYLAQVEEAKQKGSPYDQMYACAMQLRECAQQLEKAARPFCCFRCSDNTTPLYCLNCASEIQPKA